MTDTIFREPPPDPSTDPPQSGGARTVPGCYTDYEPFAFCHWPPYSFSKRSVNVYRFHVTV